MNDPLANLNPEQREAVTHTHGPLMIIAGAGTGKTAVMTRRMAWLIQQGFAKPDEILALTFTDKAAEEMEERVDKWLPYGYTDLWISTFHAFCQRVLESHGLDIGLSNRPRVLTETDAWVLLREHLSRLSLDYYRPLGNPTKFLRAFLGHVSRLKDEGLSPEAYRRFVADHPHADAIEQKRREELVGAYETYEQILLEKGAIDFGGLQTSVLRLFQTRPNVLAEYQKQFKAIIVDEFQDTNRVQYDLLALLAGRDGNIAIVGDDDQAVYQFRGASAANIYRFHKEYPNARRIVLTKNYRSVQPVLDRAYAFIAGNNPDRLEVALQASHGLSKRLESQRYGEGGVEHLHAATLEDEVVMVTEKILGLKVATACDWSDMALLVRANDHAEPFLPALVGAGIPFRFMAMSGLYRQGIILDAVALLRLIDSPFDSPSAFRLLSHPSIGISSHDLSLLSHATRKVGTSLLQAIDAATEVSSEGTERLREFSTMLQELRALCARRNVLEVFAEAMNHSGLHGAILQTDEAEQTRAFGLLNQFVERMRRFIQLSAHGSVRDFLSMLDLEQSAGDEGALNPDDQASPDEVQVMTLHGAKGLEFRFVFILNMVDRRFPSAHRGDPIPLPEGLIENGDETKAHLAEERRLCYVGMTRAKERVFFTSAEDYGGARKKKPSLFLSELGFDQTVSVARPLSTLTEEGKRDHVLSSGGDVDVSGPFSFSQLAAYDHCPLQYKFANVLKIPTFGKGNFSFGKTIHATLEQYFREWMVASPVPLDRLLKLYRLSWLDEWYESHEQKETYRQQGEDQLRAFHARLQEHPPQPLFLERGFTVKFGDIVIKGRVDRIDRFEDGVEIIDYKTGTPKTKKTLTPTDRMQMYLYAMAAREVFELKPKRLTFYYFSDQSTVSFEPKHKDMERLQEHVGKSIEQITARQFEPAPGVACRSCDFKSICPFRAL